MLNHKGQFLLLSTAILIISMFATFEYIITSSETSGILFQPSFSQDAINLFRAVKIQTEGFNDSWYNFSTFQAKRKFVGTSGNTAYFNVTHLNCSEIAVTNLSNVKKVITYIEYEHSCGIKLNDIDAAGGYIYYAIKNNTGFKDLINITIKNELSPLYFRRENGAYKLRSKLCDHISNIYSSKQIQLNCTIY